jgi:aminodeoxychorismate synthase component I
VKVAFRDKIAAVQAIDMTADELVSALLALAANETVCILDSCGIGYLGSHLLIAGIGPVETIEITHDKVEQTLLFLDEKLSGDLASIFTLSYHLGLKVQGIDARKKPVASPPEPDVFVACFDTLIFHDYNTGVTWLAGNAGRFGRIREKLVTSLSLETAACPVGRTKVLSNFTKSEYLDAIGTIQERIRCGDTYQTNLTQQLRAKLADELTPATIFERLRQDHPAPFSAFITRSTSTVVSASPERFFRVDNDRQTITTSPIKGTRRRGDTADEDARLRLELLESTKDRAENTMIVDLLRNDLGRVCRYGSVRVKKLCDLEQHPTLYHLVSTISGELRAEARISDILKAVYPCGSITGAPKISTMQIIDEIETVDRGLSMGAIGYFAPRDVFGMPETLDLSVAIRTMVISEGTVVFNVGGGIVIDSEPESEYDETLTKAKALLAALGAGAEFRP